MKDCAVSVYRELNSRSRDCDRTVQARQARVLHPASIFVTHCVRAARLGVGFSIVTRRRVQRSLARVHLEDGAAGAPCLSLSLSLGYFLSVPRS